MRLIIYFIVMNNVEKGGNYTIDTKTPIDYKGVSLSSFDGFFHAANDYIGRETEEKNIELVVGQVFMDYGIIPMDIRSDENIQDQINTYLTKKRLGDNTIKAIQQQIATKLGLSEEQSEKSDINDYDFFNSINSKIIYNPLFFTKGASRWDNLQFNKDKFSTYYLNLLNQKDTSILTEDFKIKFINDNFKDLTEGEKIKLSKILDIIVENEIQKQVMNNYGEYTKDREKREEERRIREERKLQESNKDNVKAPQNTITKIETNSGYISGSSTYEITASNGKTKKITLSPEELKVVGKNENIINEISEFYNLLNELGIGELIDYREDIFKAISKENGIAFKAYDGDYANSELEIKILLNSILKSIGIPEIQNGNFKEFIEEFKRLNKRGPDNVIDKSEDRNESSIEKQFLDRFDFRRNHMFLYATFLDSI